MRRPNRYLRLYCDVYAWRFPTISFRFKTQANGPINREATTIEALANVVVEKNLEGVNAGHA